MVIIIIFFSSQSRDHQTKVEQCKVSKINSIRIKRKTSDKKKTGSESAEQLVPDFLQLESVTADIRCHSSPQRDLHHFSSSQFCTFHPIWHFLSYSFPLFILFCTFHPLNETCATFHLLFLPFCFMNRICTLNCCFLCTFNISLELFINFFWTCICMLCTIHPFFCTFHPCFALFSLQ